MNQRDKKQWNKLKKYIQQDIERCTAMEKQARKENKNLDAEKWFGSWVTGKVLLGQMDILELEK